MVSRLDAAHPGTDLENHATAFVTTNDGVEARRGLHSTLFGRAVLVVVVDPSQALIGVTEPSRRPFHQDFLLTRRIQIDLDDVPVLATLEYDGCMCLHFATLLIFAPDGAIGLYTSSLRVRGGREKVDRVQKGTWRSRHAWASSTVR